MCLYQFEDEEEIADVATVAYDRFVEERHKLQTQVLRQTSRRSGTSHLERSKRAATATAGSELMKVIYILGGKFLLADLMICQNDLSLQDLNSKEESTPSSARRSNLVGSLR